jgi:hypothetical protein
MIPDLNALREAARTGRFDKATRRQVFSDLKHRAGPLYELLDIAGWMTANEGPSKDELSILESFSTTSRTR